MIDFQYLGGDTYIANYKKDNAILWRGTCVVQDSVCTLALGKQFADNITLDEAYNFVIALLNVVKTMGCVEFKVPPFGSPSLAILFSIIPNVRFFESDGTELPIQEVKSRFITDKLVFNGCLDVLNPPSKISLVIPLGDQ